MAKEGLVEKLLVPLLNCLNEKIDCNCTSSELLEFCTVEKLVALHWIAFEHESPRSQLYRAEIMSSVDSIVESPSYNVIRSIASDLCMPLLKVIYEDHHNDDCIDWRPSKRSDHRKEKTQMVSRDTPGTGQPVNGIVKSDVVPQTCQALFRLLSSCIQRSYETMCEIFHICTKSILFKLKMDSGGIVTERVTHEPSDASERDSGSYECLPMKLATTLISVIYKICQSDKSKQLQLELDAAERKFFLHIIETLKEYPIKFDFALPLLKELCLGTDAILKSERLQIIFDTVVGQQDIKFGFSQPLAVLSYLVDFFLSREGNKFDVKRETEFWNLLQNGLLHDNPLTRKRSIYILKRALECILTMPLGDGIFMVGNSSDPLLWWNQVNSETLQHYWQSFILLIETLNEKQNHIIFPVLPTIEDIIDGVCSTATHSNFTYMNITWLTTVLRKAFQHESKQVVKWAFHRILKCKQTTVLKLTEECIPFILDSMFPALGQEHLYARDLSSSKGAPPVIYHDLVHFFNTCKDVLEHTRQTAFFQKTIENISRIQLNGVPLFYVIKALSEVHPKPFVTKHVLQDIRNIVACNISTFPVKIRRGICCSLTKIIFVDHSSDISPLDLASYLTLLLETNHLHYGDPLWINVITWTEQSRNWFPDDCWLPPIQRCSQSNLLSSTLHVIGGSELENLLQKVNGENSGRLILLLMWGLDLFWKRSYTPREVDCTSIEKVAQDTLLIMFTPILDFVTKLNTNPYLCQQKVHNILVFVKTLLVCILERNASDSGISVEDRTALRRDGQVGIQHPLDTILLDAFTNSLSSLLKFFENNICGTSNGDQSDAISIRFELQDVIFRVIKTFNLHSLLYHAATHLSKVLTTNLDVLMRTSKLNRDFKVFTSVMSVSFACKHLPHICSESSASAHLENIFSAMQDIIINSYGLDTGKRENSDVVMDQGSSPVRQAHVIGSFWGCIVIALQNRVFTLESTNAQRINSIDDPTLRKCDVHTFIESIVETCNFVASSDLIPLLKCMALVLPSVSAEDIDLIHFILDNTWRLFREQNRRDAAYWPLLENFCPILFHPCLLEIAVEKVQSFWQQMLQIGDEKGGVFNAVINYVTVHWLNIGKKQKLVVHRCFSDLMVDAVIFGPIYRKNMSILRDSKEYIIGNVCDKKDDEDDRLDWLIRSKLISFFVNFESGDTVRNFKFDMIKALITKDNDISLNTKRYFGNSLVHRQKIRLWQTVLVLLDFCKLDQCSQKDEISNLLFQSLYFDNQPNVRQFIEWVTILFFEQHSSHRELLWIKMEEGGEHRIGILTSLISIVYHLAILLNEEEFASFVDVAMSRLLRWTQVQHMQVKLHAQVVLQRLWKECKSRGIVEMINKYRIITQCFLLTEKNSSVVKHRQELERSFFFSSFHALEHYSLETIFSKFLKFSGVADDEWLSSNCFHIPLNRRLKVDDNLKVDTLQQNTEKDEDVVSQESGIEARKDFQKKITPWNVLPPLEDPLFSETFLRLKEEGQGQLIVCASLIDRTPNLGGLCRTCEIFGVKTLVLGSLKYLQETTFKSLSVSSEKWVNIEQIIPRRIPEYIREKKKAGYRIVGVEQTTESTSLEEYHFFEKSVLLLGNEKEGIPVDIIQMLDDCVEIPQQGIIRSLNVHVSGAIMIWEYSRQQLSRKTK